MITFREVVRDDHARVVTLLQTISHFEPAPAELPSIFEQFHRQDHVIALVALVDGEEDIVAYGSVCVEMKIRGGSMGHIEEIVVDERYRGRGIGSALVTALVQRAKDRGAYKVTLECRPEKQGFYEQLGFAATGLAMNRLI